ncbi:hypothetical protein L1785_16540 [Antribacter sp. KLBMP9083]|uniref:Uncharacterized protein n=1 Tax=Antribacter soli TaxID=2910976 RepID=A0AA41QGB2_9MICO|nr:hypothetical protein [Antribacter soli]MCF4122588.1 hypothetical protein [Antribacter soli]
MTRRTGRRPAGRPVRSAPWRDGAAAVLAGLLACGVLLAGCTGDASEDPTPVPSQDPVTAAADAATAWLAGFAAEATARLEAGRSPDGRGIGDHGPTRDVLLALVATGQDAAVGPLAAALAEPAHVDAHLGDGEHLRLGGSTAELAAALTAAGHDPRAVGGLDLVAEVRALVGKDGRVGDRGVHGHTQTAGQAWSVVVLTRAGVPEADAVTGALTDLQCDDGSFPASPDDEQCVGDVEATSLAIVALQTREPSAPEATAARDWLLSQATPTEVDGAELVAWQAADDTGLSVVSTALAVLALTELEPTAAVPGMDIECRTLRPAREWLAAQAVTRGDDAGALAVDQVADPRATAWGAMALSGTRLTTVLDG